MKKIGIAVIAAISLIVAAVALAAPQVNTYSVTAKTSPTKAGTAKKPVPIQLTFNYKVGEQSGQRPAGVNEYRITFAGVKEDGSFRDLLRRADPGRSEQRAVPVQGRRRHRQDQQHGRPDR